MFLCLLLPTYIIRLSPHTFVQVSLSREAESAPNYIHNSPIPTTGAVAKFSNVFAPAPEPETERSRYRVLSNTVGVRVSPLALGAMSLGSAWPDFMGSVEEEKSFQLVDAYADGGGNFIDTANNYQDEQSEEYIGK